MRRFGLLAVITLVSALLIPIGVVAAQPENFVAHLSGDEGVPARDTNATGQAKFQLDRTGTSLDFKVIVANIDNVVAAHIHCAPAGENGPVGVTLFSGGSPGSGPVNGILSQGTITTPDAGNGCGWTALADVIADMRSGDAYVNVHTNDGVEPTNTGPGDFPGGEIRGQIR